jgi:hypothetical protein
LFTLRPTARLLKRLRVPLTIEPPETTTRLGDWYVNLLHVGRQQLVLAVADVAYGKTTNRQILGVMVDFAKGLPFYVDREGTLLNVSMTLAETPCSPLYKTTISPDRTTIALFEEAAPRRVH